MRKQEIECAVMVLVMDIKSGSLIGRELFFKHLQVYYNAGLLEDLDALSEVLKERNAQFLIDPIALYSRSSAQQLDVLILD